MADPVDAIQKHMPDWIFQPPMMVLGHEPNQRHVVPVGGPNRVLNVVEDLTRRSSAQRNASQGSGASVASVKSSVETDCQLPALRNRKEFRVFQAEFARAVVVGARHVKLIIATVPGCAIDDASVRSKAGIADRPGAKRNLLVIGRKC